MQLKTLRIVGLLEGLSFLFLLGIAMPLKYLFDMPTAVKITGMAHGVLFIAYCLLVIMVGVEKSWSFKKYAIAFIGSILPFGTFYADKKVFQA